jgi:TetR/AcrR family transcriptional regulator
VAAATQKLGAQAITAAAIDLFSKEKFESVSIAQIAAAAGVCKANVFHHFESKEALYLAVMREISALYLAQTEAVLAEPAPSAEKLHRLLVLELKSMVNDAQRTRLVLRESMDDGHADARALAQKAYDRNSKAVIALFEEGRGSGEFRADIDPACAALHYTALKLVFFQYHDCIRQQPEMAHLCDIEIFAKHTCALLLYGLLNPPKTAPAPQPKTRASRKARSSS